MEIKVQDEKRAALVAGLRELADFLATHPDLPAKWYQDINIPTDVATVQAVAGQLGLPVAENWSKDMGRLHSVGVELGFGSVGVKWYAMDPGAMAEYAAREKLGNAARWVYTCDGSQSVGYTTEGMARQQLDAHREGCTGGAHSVKLVSGEAAHGELVRA